ncbi:MAG: S16 family serine protease, partial [Phycisphaeraceae bacterium]
TARIRMGKGELVDIEREVALGGPLHSKGVLILSGFLKGRYAPDVPLSLAASIVFEQSYSGVDGDSASLAELFALLSAIADVPFKQTLAITGSLNQHGMAQAIGGVNEKIEGFFDACQAADLSGEQGVIIPVANTQHLMLRRDVVEAVEAGTFHIWPIETVDEGLELFTDQRAGAPDADGRYPEDTVNGRVQRRLLALADQRKLFGSAAD